MTKRFSASSAERLMSCHASANLEAAIPGFVEPPRRVGMAADKGTDIHSIFEKVWELGPSDMARFAQAVAYVAEVRMRRRFKVMIEQTMKATWLTGDPDTTADLVLYTQDELHIIDTKAGKIPVPVAGNKQLLYYAVTYAALAPKAKGVHLHIVQPWADNMEEVFVTADELKAFMNEAVAADVAIQAGDLSFGPSDHGCLFCPANPQSRGPKATRFCPVMLQILYPPTINEAEILDL